MSERGSTGAVEEFLELEAELSSGTKRAETYEQGNIAGVAKIPAEEVPEDYPVSIETREALHLDVETPGGETVATYIEWPGEDEESDHVERLLDALGRTRDEFANVYGDRVALDAVDGWHGIDPERTAAFRGGKRTNESDAPALTKHLLGGAVTLGAIGYAMTSSLPDLAVLPVVLSWLAIPLLLYYDGKRVEESTHWSPKKVWWTIGGLVPLWNVSVGMAYLLERYVQFTESTVSDVADKWHELLIGGLVLSVAAFALVGVSADLGSLLFLFSFGVLPFGVYYDAKYADETTDWSPSEMAWAVVTGLTGPLGAAAYLLVRRGELG